jgi:hypothetical protein
MEVVHCQYGRNIYYKEANVKEILQHQSNLPGFERGIPYIHSYS